jgi:S1-C subfamily serine protease
VIGAVRTILVVAVALVATVASTELGGAPGAAPESTPVVGVRAIGPRRTTLATGVAVGDRLVLTVAHALADADRVQVGGHPACALVVDRRRDVAVLAVPRLQEPAIRLAERARPGDAWLVRLADDAGAQRTPRREISPVAVRRRFVARVHELDGTRYERAALELQSSLAPGDSGSPVLDARGRLIGIMFAASREHRNTSYGVTVDELVEPIEAATARSCGSAVRSPDRSLRTDGHWSGRRPAGPLLRERVGAGRRRQLITPPWPAAVG